MSDRKTELKECLVCKGRGYLRCPCWPGDCICGQDDEDCENCGGTGWLDPAYDDDRDQPIQKTPAQATRGPVL